MKFLIPLSIFLVSLPVIFSFFHNHKKHLTFPKLSTLRKQMIDDISVRLIKSFGNIHKSFDMDLLDGINPNSISGVGEIAYCIAHHYKLGCAIKMHVSGEDKSADNGKAVSAAWIEIPKHIPDYKNWEFSDFVFNVFITKNTLENYNLVQMVMVIAHELAHAMLYSRKHVDRDSEIATDMLAILLGFDNVYMELNRVNIFDGKELKSAAKDMLESELEANKSGESLYASRAERLYAYFKLKPENLNKFIFAQVTNFLFEKLLSKLGGK